MRTYEEILDAALRADVPAEVAARAAAMITSGKVTLLGFSGKMASGKDSVADAVMSRLGLADAIHYSFATPLKEEVDVALKLARDGRTSEIMSTLGVHDGDVGGKFLTLLNDALAVDPTASARTRTPEMRRVLQFWGTEIRRAEDYNYWVNKALHVVLDHAAHGGHVYFTDGRFENEIAGSQEVGFRVVRLEVSPEVQARRLEQRDGLKPDPVSLLHPSEIALDNYTGFDLVVNNEGPFEASVEVIARWLIEKQSNS